MSRGDTTGYQATEASANDKAIHKCGYPEVRVCAFHADSAKYGSSDPSLIYKGHRWMRAMWAEIVLYDVEIVGGDANPAGMTTLETYKMPRVNPL